MTIFEKIQREIEEDEFDFDSIHLPSSNRIENEVFDNSWHSKPIWISFTYHFISNGKNTIHWQPPCRLLDIDSNRVVTFLTEADYEQNIDNSGDYFKYFNNLYYQSGALAYGTYFDIQTSTAYTLTLNDNELYLDNKPENAKIVFKLPDYNLDRNTRGPNLMFVSESKKEVEIMSVIFFLKHQEYFDKLIELGEFNYGQSYEYFMKQNVVKLKEKRPDLLMKIMG